MLHAHYNSGINDISLISRPNHALRRELEDTDTNTPLTKVVSNRNLVELLETREEGIYTVYGV